MKGIIVGIQQEGKQKLYRVVLYNRTENDCQYAKKAVPEEHLVKLISDGTLELDNATVKDGKIKGTTGDLNRFNNSAGFHPLVILSEIVADGRIMGYRTATFDGTVKALRLKDILAYCDRVNSNGVPIQNAMYVPESDTNKAHIRSYAGKPFFQETIKRRKSNVAQPARPDIKENRKQVSKLEELFNRAQIEQLKLGKENGVDIKVFGNNKLSADQMKEIRLGLESGINARAFADPSYPVSAMKALRINAKYGVDVTYFVNPKFNAEQIYELSTGFLSGVDIAQYADPSLSAKDMSKKRVYLESKLWNEVKATEDK